MLPHFNALPSNAFADKQSRPRPFGFAVGADERRDIKTRIENYATDAVSCRSFNKGYSEVLLKSLKSRPIETAETRSEDFARMQLDIAAILTPSPKYAHQSLVEYLTRPNLTSIYNTHAELPLVGLTDVPTLDELQCGTESLFQWLTATFAAACQQVRDSGGRVPPNISFRAPKYADRIAPELAALLDAQIAHYALCGVVPVAEYRAPDASLHIARLLPPRLSLNWLTRGHGFFSREMQVMMPLRHALQRVIIASMWNDRPRFPLDENSARDPPSFAPLRVELFFQVAAEERFQWAGLENGRLLTQHEVSGRRTYSIAVVADATLPLRFKLRNLNEAVWAE